VYRATSRLSVLKFTAATIVSVAAMAAAVPGVISSFTRVADPASAAVPPAEAISLADARGSLPAAPVIKLRPRNYASVEDLPPAGQIADLALTAPADSAVALLHFAPRQTVVADVTLSTFAKPDRHIARRVILARLPQARPGRVFSLGPDGAVVANTAVLAYAATPSEGLEAPFDAVIGTAPRISTADTESVDADDVDESGVYRPHPRPDPSLVLNWLDGRALGQFAPGQHDWVRNPLPASVFQPREQRCLAQGIYFEARGEPDEGQAAVAQVILNRVRNPAYPKSICGVVYQNEKWRNRCQFSFACDGRPENITERDAWAKAQKIASDVTSGKIWVTEVGDSTHYHAGYVSPRWDRRMTVMDRLGQHIFYRTKNGGWS
jgi:hypothetical protein